MRDRGPRHSTHAGRDTRIESVVVTTGQPITVATTGGHTTWQPATAAAFIGADAGGGPSADYCCDYLNFFADHATAQVWISSHPGGPGRVPPPARSRATRHLPCSSHSSRPDGRPGQGRCRSICRSSRPTTGSSCQPPTDHPLTIRALPLQSLM
ncbi:organomercurial lyase [Kribbella sp. CA-293567]|uniref:organomercurial lyase n=1 Tax=Kribbella sp. CA-293567 TaxID=3002436 RepID=UPI0022DE00B6|nr:organomercurial lyase [Kribbella sp. CA-293567]WBQ04334.1 organomercurial lyase [Kribbella sp. CA-293567]